MLSVDNIENDEKNSLLLQEEEAELINDEHAHYLNEAEKLKQFYIHSYQKEVNQISADYRGEAELLLQEGKELCLKMAEDQREEVRKLVEEWDNARNRQIEHETETYNSRKETAKVLATYSCFETAKQIKNVVEKEESKRSEQLKSIDCLYMEQFKLMISRHEKDFNLLFQRVRAKVQSSRKDAEFLKKKADADKITKDSEIPVVIMSSVTVQTKHEETKKLVIKSFSPRNLKKTGNSTKQSINKK